MGDVKTVNYPKKRWQAGHAKAAATRQESPSRKKAASVGGAEYSFNGTTWSESNKKENCQPGGSYTAYIRRKETDTHNAGPVAQITKTAPKLKQEVPTETTGETDRKVKVSSIKITGISKKIAVGKSLKLTAKVTPSNAANQSVIWSSKYQICNGKRKGVVTTKKAGKGKKVKITAKATDGSNKKKTITIKIK